MVRLLVLLLGFFFLSNSNAQRLPLWEMGAGVGYGKVPYYRGSASSRNIILPLPLAIFRGKKYNLDEDGGRRSLFRSKRLKMDLSLGAGLPVPTEGQAKARKGMPSLDATLELGPRLKIVLWKKSRHSLWAVIPFRWTASLSFSDVAYRGWIFSPYVVYTIENKNKNSWQFDILTGPIYASEKYHDYFYSVDQAYMNQDRRFFQAKQGYSGSRVTVYFQKNFQRLWLSVFARYDVLTDAVFEDSPLVETKKYAFGGFVIGWMFKKSSHSVWVHD